MVRIVVDQLQCWANDRVVFGVPPRRGVLVAVEPGAQHGDQQQIEQPVQIRLLAGTVVARLGGEQIHQRAFPFVSPQQQHRRQRVEQARADLAAALVGADHRARHARRAVAPCTHPERHFEPQVITGQRGAALARMDDDHRRRGRVVGEHVVVGAAGQRDVARPQQDSPRAFADDRRTAVGLADQGQRRLVFDAHRPRRIHHHP